MDIVAAKLGANMAISELAASGKIGSDTRKTYTHDGYVGRENDFQFSEFSEATRTAKFYLWVSGETPDLHTFASYTVEEGTSFVGTGTQRNVYSGDVEILEVAEGDATLFGAKGSIILKDSEPQIAVVTDTLDSPFLATGLYFVRISGYNGTPSIIMTEAQFGEVKPIDNMYVHNVIELKEFDCELQDGTIVSFNDVIMQAVMTSVSSGGALQRITCKDLGGCLETAARGFAPIYGRTEIQGSLQLIYPLIKMVNLSGDFTSVMCCNFTLGIENNLWADVFIEFSFVYKTRTVTINVIARPITA